MMDITKRRMKEVKVLGRNGQQKRLVSDVKIQWAMDTLQVG
jgi:hypothetical protein